MKAHLVMVVVFVFAITACDGTESVQLKLNFAKVESYRMATVVAEQTTISTLNRTQETDSETYTEIRYDVVEVATDGSARVDVTYETVVITQTDHIGNQEVYESRVDKRSPRLVDPILSMVGKTFTVVYGPTGEIIETYGLAEIIEESMSGTVPGIEDNPVFSISVVDALDHAIKSSSSLLISMLYPSEPVKVGQTWKNTRDVSAEYAVFTLNNTIDVTQIEDTFVTLAISATGVIEQHNIASYLTLIEVNEDAEGDVAGSLQQSGTMQVNRATGLIDSSVINGTIEITLNILDTSIPMNIEMTTTSRRLP